MKEKTRNPEPKTGKRLLVLLLVIALILMGLVAGLLGVLFSGLHGSKAETPDLEAYLSEHWTVFRLRRWDAETGSLELEYLLRFTYAQMEQYGGELEELRTLPAGNLETLGSLKAAVREALGQSLRAVTVYGLTSDGQIAYTLYPDGQVEACWDEP